MLVDLTDIKEYLGVTDGSQDDFLNQQGAMISDAIENYCGRKFLQAGYVQTFYSADFDNVVPSLKLFHYPIIGDPTIKEDDVDVTNEVAFRIHRQSGTVIRPDMFFAGVDKVEVSFTAGYEILPPVIENVFLSILQEKYNKKVSGVPLNFGSDVQRISIPGVISVDFDYTLESNQRKNAYGTIIGSYANILDPWRSERRVIGSGKLEFIEDVP